MVDAMATLGGRLSYARVQVEFGASIPLCRTMEVDIAKGKAFIVKIEYEFFPP